MTSSHDVNCFFHGYFQGLEIQINMLEIVFLVDFFTDWDPMVNSSPIKAHHLVEDFLVRFFQASTSPKSKNVILIPSLYMATQCYFTNKNSLTDFCVFFPLERDKSSQQFYP